MPDTLTAKQKTAFKIGARARKFLLEGCPVEGYDYLYTTLAETRAADPELAALLDIECDKYALRVERWEDGEDAATE